MGEAKKGERILVIEPERDIALVLQMLLHDEGYQAERACGIPHVGKELAERGADLVILDVYSAPGATATAAESLLPILSGQRIPVLCVSTDRHTIATAAANPCVVGAIEMPFDAATLLRKVRAALDSAGGAREGQTGSQAA